MKSEKKTPHFTRQRLEEAFIYIKLVDVFDWKLMRCLPVKMDLLNITSLSFSFDFEPCKNDVMADLVLCQQAVCFSAIQNKKSHNLGAMQPL